MKSGPPKPRVPYRILVIESEPMAFLVRGLRENGYEVASSGAENRPSGAFDLILSVDSEGLALWEMDGTVTRLRPFSFSDLMATLRHLEREGREPTGTVRVADLEVDLEKQVATRRGPLNLTPKEFRLLEVLARRQGEVVSQRALAREVWDLEIDDEAGLVEFQVRRLQEKVNGHDLAPLIHASRGVGYWLGEKKGEDR